MGLAVMGLFQCDFFNIDIMGRTLTSCRDIGYLNSQQALVDYAVLIRSLKQNPNSEASPVVVFGGSYEGSKFKLPHLTLDDFF